MPEFAVTLKKDPAQQPLQKRFTVDIDKIFGTEENFSDDERAESVESVHEEEPEAKSEGESDSEYERLIKDMLQPPKSLLKNAPLHNYSEKMPQWFTRDSLFEVKNDHALVPRLNSRAQQRMNLKSPTRGNIRCCRVAEELRILNTGHYWEFMGESMKMSTMG